MPLRVIKSMLDEDPERARALVELEDRILERALAGEQPRVSVAELRRRYEVPPEVLGRTDPDGVSVAQAMTAAGIDPEHAGPDRARLGRLGAFVELHVEQGTHTELLAAGGLYADLYNTQFGRAPGAIAADGRPVTRAATA